VKEYFLFAWGDECYKSKWSSLAVFIGTVITRSVLPNRVTQEIYTHVFLMLMEGMSYSCFAWFSFQTNAIYLTILLFSTGISEQRLGLHAKQQSHLHHIGLHLDKRCEFSWLLLRLSCEERFV
jgi:hypothetical protein